ncbi:MAG: hypothetical protein FJW94_02430 [Actinobacteria bacterium]|nr:hypothetical protein [Actinomycetota bacterium]
MEWIEISASSVAEARERALDELGIDDADAEFEVLEEPRSGLFGRTRGVARIRARVVPKGPRPKSERPRRREDRGGSGKSNNRRRPPKSATATDANDRVDDARKPTNSASRVPQEPARPRQSEKSQRQERAPMDAAEQEAVAREFLEGLSDAIGLETTVSAVLTDDNDLRIEVDGSEVGLFIGPGLQTLDSIQEITRHVVQREAGDREYGRVLVDVAGVREARRTALEAFVKTTAEQVVRDGVAVPFEPMSSPDRKVVHDTIAEIDGVESVSDGEEPNRRVVVRPS